MEGVTNVIDAKPFLQKWFIYLFYKTRNYLCQLVTQHVLIHREDLTELFKDIFKIDVMKTNTLSPTIYIWALATHSAYYDTFVKVSSPTLRALWTEVRLSGLPGTAGSVDVGVACGSLTGPDHTLDRLGSTLEFDKK